ncbi:hypothetical protein CRG98_020133 [Punica granatum]|uniref:Uncharacterized protein n=1 Tax=Punica granatum TaxID=22663 RepID=A0A2I0JTB2_PUNGR|nr:hypothetical protein CRG98_020133 [Punica granatum]
MDIDRRKVQQIHGKAGNSTCRGKRRRPTDRQRNREIFDQCGKEPGATALSPPETGESRGFLGGTGEGGFVRRKNDDDVEVLGLAGIGRSCSQSLLPCSRWIGLGRKMMTLKF